MRVLGQFLWISAVFVGCSDPAPTPNNQLDAGADAAEGGPEHQPRRPVPDLRFKWVGQTERIHVREEFIGLGSALGSGLGIGRSSEAAISPLQFELGYPAQIQSSDDDAGTPTYVTGSWSFFRFVPDEPTELLWTFAQAGSTVRLEDDLKKVHDDHDMITSFDFATAEGSRAAYGLIAVRSDDGRPLFDSMSSGSVLRDALAQSIADAAKRGLVTTALSGDGSDIRFFAYNSIGDEQRYETEVRRTNLDQLSDQARELADAGYIITAFGKDGADLLLVGTRPVGTSEARTIAVHHSHGLDVPTDLEAAPVAWLFTPDGEILLLEH